jgi:hypothetical protein
MSSEIIVRAKELTLRQFPTAEGSLPGPAAGDGLAAATAMRLEGGSVSPER